jgi:hypothetical protein
VIKPHEGSAKEKVAAADAAVVKKVKAGATLEYG